MARFGSLAEIAEYIGCPPTDLELVDLQRMARRVTVHTAAHGKQTYLELDLTEARPIIRAIRERLKAEELAKPKPEPEPEETVDDSWRLFKVYRPTTDGDE
jgi:hypothetical protein